MAGTGVSPFAFIRYISGNDNSSNAWQQAYKSLTLHPSQLSSLTGKPSEREKFIHRFDRYSERLVRFLKNFPQSSSNALEAGSTTEKQKNIADIIIGHLLSDLLSPAFSQLWEKDSLFKLAIVTLQFAHADHLRHIADLLTQCRSLLAKIVSSDQCRELMRNWTRILCTQSPNTTTLESWVEIIIECCSACGNHRALEAILAGRSANRITSLGETAFTLTKLCNLMPCHRCFSRAKSGSISRKAELSRDLVSSEPWMAASNTDLIEQGLEDLLFSQGIGLWKIVLSAKALDDLRKSKLDSRFHLVWGKLQDLSTGDWIRKSVAQPYSMPAEAPNQPKVRLFVASCDSDGTKAEILWQVDCAYDSRVRSNSQIVKVWRIGTTKEIAHAAGVVARTQRQWSGAHVARCKVNDVDKDLRIKIPALFAEDPTYNDIDVDPENGLEYEQEVSSLNLLISNKFHALTNRVFNNILYGNPYALFPYDPNATEVTVIKHFETAAFILGRSGTGKTTCLLYKLLSRYIASRADATDDNEHCQILITRSKELTKKLHVELEGLIKAQILNPIQTRTVPAPYERQEKWDGSSEETDKTLFDLRKYRFPLVCTFAHFLRLMENSIVENDRTNSASPIRAVADTTNTTTDFVSFKFFKSVYWPKLAYQGSLGLHLDAGMVFSEIMGVIKGSASTRNGLKPLSREAYITRSPNLAPVFPKPEARSLLYELYTQYEQRKLQRGDEDAIDRIIKVLHGLKRYKLEENLKDVIQEIYVDEVQDQRPIELELFLHLVKSPRGVHFAGDSAQCISNDSAFRFANVKALFFDHYAKTEYKLSRPHLFKLSRNFRSRQGILTFSSFIMSLLWNGFPTMVDKLDPEIGESPGPKPIIFVGDAVTGLLEKASYLVAHEDTENTSELESSNTQEGSTKQVVIVRDDDTRSYVKSLLGNRRMVYTILETKGMEYDDVFLFNFFESSPCSGKMRTLEELLSDNINESYAERNMLMCSELKNLYVAVTRACNRLWLLENSRTSAIDFLSNLSRPLQEIRYISGWQSLPETIAETLRPAAQTSTLDWVRAGDQNMEKELYDRAWQCFQNAGDSYKADLAEAFYNEQIGREQRANGMQSFREWFMKAAKLFHDCKKLSQCAMCLEAAGEMVQAAEMWSYSGDYLRAGSLYEKAGKLYAEKGASEYYKAGQPGEALNLLYKFGYYEGVINRLAKQDYEIGKINDVQKKSLVIGCNEQLRKAGEEWSKKIREKAFNLFGTNEEKETYLESHGHHSEFVEFCAELGQFPRAVWQLVVKGELRDILKLSLETDKERPWPSDCDGFFGDVYQLMKTKMLFDALDASTGVKELELESVFTIEESFRNMPWAERWHQQFDTCREMLEESVFPSQAHGCTVYPKIVSGLIFAKTDYLTARVTTSLSQLGRMFEYLQNFVESFNIQPQVPGEFSDDLESALWWLGPIKNPWEPSVYHCTAWSHLKQRHQIFEEAHRYLVSLVPNVVEKILSRAAHLHILKIPNYPCQECVFKGDWLPADDDSIYHPLISPEAYKREFLQERVLWWKKRVGFRGMCFRYGLLLPNSHLKFANQLDLGKQCQYFFSYRSAFVDDAGVIREACDQILTRASYKTLLQQFQTLTRRALSREIKQLQKKNEEKKGLQEKNEEKKGFKNWKQGDLSNLIKFYRLLWTFSPLTIIKGDVSLIEEQLHKAEISLVYSIPIIKCYEEFKWLPQSQLNFPKTITCVYNLHKALHEFISNSKCYSYDVEIMGIYEEIATLLLFLGWPKEIPLMIPNSWSKLYLSHWRKALTLCPPNERRAYQYLLYELSLSFCSMITLLDNQVQKNINPTLQGLLERRGVDFVMVVLLNFNNLRPMSSLYMGLDNEVQKVLSIPVLRTKTVCSRPSQELLDLISQAFKVYNGKDYLCLYGWETDQYKDNEKAKEHFLPNKVHKRPSHIGAESINAGAVNPPEVVEICARAEEACGDSQESSTWQ